MKKKSKKINKYKYHKKKISLEEIIEKRYYYNISYVDFNRKTILYTNNKK